MIKIAKTSDSPVNNKTVICDIDFYAEKPYINKMGATVFALFSEYDRSFEKWPFSKKSYEVVKKSVSDERRLRQQSMQQLIYEWNAAKQLD